jgi:hypothetical protein
MPPRRRQRSIRLTAENLDHFTWLERDWVRRTSDAAPVRRRLDRAATSCAGATESAGWYDFPEPRPGPGSGHFL